MVSSHGATLHQHLHAAGIYLSLKSEGMTDEERRALESHPRIAKAILQTLRSELKKIEGRKRPTVIRVLSIEQRRKALNLLITDATFDRREFNILRREGMATLGDLAMASEIELSLINGVGDKTVDKTLEVLAEYGLDLRKPEEDPLQRALNLYGGVEFVPAKLMHHWVNGLDETSYAYLRQQGTLDTLSLRNRAEYESWRRHERPGQPDIDKVIERQLDLIEEGLQQAGLALFA